MIVFLVKSKLSTAKKSKTAVFSRVFSFHPKQFNNFSREIKVEFLDNKNQNEDFKQCAEETKTKVSYLHVQYI